MKNVIIITSDEMRGDCAGFMGNPDIKTPNLDQFANQGIAFTNHFCVHGKCVPSRVSIVTGRYSHTDGYRTIHQHLPMNEPNLLGLLKDHGYESAVFGHNHVWDDPSFWGDNTKSSGCVDYHSFTKDYFDKFTQVEKYWPDSNASSKLAFEPGFDYEGKLEGKQESFSDYVRTEQAIEYLTNVRDRSRPFFLQLNFSFPHPPYTVEEPYYSMYDRQNIKPWAYILPENAPLPLRKMREIRTHSDTSEKKFREIQAVYYGMITRMDFLFGQIMTTLKEQNLLENSVVLFAVDHGDFADQYGLVEKWDTCMSDCIMHVPLILHAPGLPKGKRVNSLSEHTDLAPTILHLLEIKPNWGVHGESLLPVINGKKVKAAVFADGGHEEEMWSRVHEGTSGKQETYINEPQTMARTKMIRTEQWKLVIRLIGGNELYDLVNDPSEMRNLFGNSAYNEIVMDLQLKMIEWCLRTDTDRPFQKIVGA